MGGTASRTATPAGTTAVKAKKSLFAPKLASAPASAPVVTNDVVVRVSPKTRQPATLRFLFVVFDAGESNLLFQTVELLHALGEAAGEIAVLALGAPSDASAWLRPPCRTLACAAARARG